MTSQSDHSASVELCTLGVVQSCFKEKFGIPRQPGLAPSARARIRIHDEFAQEDAFAGLDQCSHIWVQFIFHEAREQWLPKVRPPRLGGNKKVGVFASRSPNRPNALGLSVVALRSIEVQTDGLYLNIAGADLLNGTPVLDIKPYVPYADSVAGAVNLIAPAAPILHSVTFSEVAELFCRIYVPPPSEAALAPGNLQSLIIEILQQDPRPQYQTLDEERIYGMKLLNLNVRWQYCVVVQSCAPVVSQCYIKVLDIAVL
jgi:tRNA-Thr(GGU) m(6)t(6)A37 methyltransferase TsaA